MVVGVIAGIFGLIMGVPANYITGFVLLGLGVPGQFAWRDRERRITTVRGTLVYRPKPRGGHGSLPHPQQGPRGPRLAVPLLVKAAAERGHDPFPRPTLSARSDASQSLDTGDPSP